MATEHEMEGWEENVGIERKVRAREEREGWEEHGGGRKGGCFCVRIHVGSLQARS